MWNSQRINKMLVGVQGGRSWLTLWRWVFHLQIKNELVESQTGIVVIFSLLFRIQNMPCFYDSFQIIFYSLGFSHVAELRVQQDRTQGVLQHNDRHATPTPPYWSRGEEQNTELLRVNLESIDLEFYTDIGKFRTYLEEEFLKIWFGTM